MTPEQLDDLRRQLAEGMAAAGPPVSQEAVGCTTEAARAYLGGEGGPPPEVEPLPELGAFDGLPASLLPPGCRIAEECPDPEWKWGDL